MKNFITATLIAILIGISSTASAIWVDGYFRQDGTYVAPHYRSNPDGNPYNNKSYRW